jgi:hypothetical protein
MFLLLLFLCSNKAKQRRDKESNLKVTTKKIYFPNYILQYLLIIKYHLIILNPHEKKNQLDNECAAHVVLTTS